MLTCKQASQLISTSLDKPLSLRERLSLKLHLLICKYCVRFSQQLHAVRNALQKMVIATEQDEQIEIPKALKERIAKFVSTQSQP